MKLGKAFKEKFEAWLPWSFFMACFLFICLLIWVMCPSNEEYAKIKARKALIEDRTNWSIYCESRDGNGFFGASVFRLKAFSYTEENRCFRIVTAKVLGEALLCNVNCIFTPIEKGSK